MRRSNLAAALICLSLSPAAAADILTVEANKAVAVRLSGNAASIVIGNKNVADVAVHNEQLLFVTGKTFGTTNLMVYDRAGRQIYASEVVVSGNSANLTTITRAGSRFTYDCAPDCQSILSVGDNNAYFTTLLEQQLNLKALSEGN